MSDDRSFQVVSEDDDLDGGKAITGEEMAFDSGNADDNPYFIGEDGKLKGYTKPWTGWYKKGSSVWKICKDRDGYRVRKPGGGIDSWGTGYSWSEVKSAYGLSGISAYKSTCGPACF